jgi:hypothetical protein
MIKRILYFLVLLLVVATTLFGDDTTISLTEATEIAFRNAKHLWGDCYSDEPLPYHDENGKLIGWRFNFSVDNQFPDREILLERINNEAEGLWHADWVGEEFANMVVSARKDMPVIRQYSKGLSHEYSTYRVRERILAQEGISEYSFGNIIYINQAYIWYEVLAKGEKLYLKILPPAGLMDEDQFRDTVKDLRSLKEPSELSEFSREWDEFLNNGRTVSRSYTYISNHEYMPFYQWSYGCSPTAGAILLGWYDYNSVNAVHSSQIYSNLIDYHAFRWDPVEEHHDHRVPNLTQELAIVMETNESTGGTQSNMTAPGICNILNQNGYTGSTYAGGGSFNYNYQVSCINENRPTISNIPRHSVTAMGYAADSTYVAVHDPNRPWIENLHSSEFDDVSKILPGDGYGIHLKILHPHGVTDWHGDENGAEEWFSGEAREILWEASSLNQDFRIFYSSDGGSGSLSTWEVLAEGITDQYWYDWIIPGTPTEQGRIAVQAYDGTDILGGDGSKGNFRIRPGGTVEDINYSQQTDNNPQYYIACNTINQSNVWEVIGVRGFDPAARFYLELHNSPTFNSTVEKSLAVQGANFIVFDQSLVSPHERGFKIRNITNNAPANVTRAVGNEYLTKNQKTTLVMQPNEVVKIYSVYLSPGQYHFAGIHSEGHQNLGMALYSSNDDPYKAKSNNLFSANMQDGLAESTVNISQAGHYALVVWSNESAHASLDISYFSEGSWIGGVDEDWNNPDNWAMNTIPGQNTDVIITSLSNNMPIVPSGTVIDINSLTILKNSDVTFYNSTTNINTDFTITGRIYSDHQPLTFNIGGGLKIFSQYAGSLTNTTINAGSIIITPNNTLTLTEPTINVTGNIAVSGLLTFLGNTATTNLGGSLSVGELGSVIIANPIEMNVAGDFNIMQGATVSLDRLNLTFSGSSDSEILLNSSPVATIRKLTVNKSGSARAIYLSDSTSDLFLQQGLVVSAEGCFQNDYNGDITINTLYQVTGDIVFNSGELILKGISDSAFSISVGSRINNLALENSFITLASNILLHGNIEFRNQTVMFGHNRIIEIKGNWHNLSGLPTNFAGANSTVKFSGTGDQIIQDVSFDTLENSSSGNLIINDSEVECNIYKWTSGGIRVRNNGIFTAYDLEGNGVKGGYILESGTINLYQDSAQTINLEADFNISYGNLNIYGGNGDARIPFNRNCNLTMSGGNLNIIDNGITFEDNGYSLVNGISGGKIISYGNFRNERLNLYFAYGTIEIAGAENSSIFSANATAFNNLIINKGSASRVERDNNQDRSNPVVSLLSNIAIDNDLDIYSGILDISGKTVTIENDLLITGILRMNSANDLLKVMRDVKWLSGSSADVNNGQIDVYGDWYFNGGLASLQGNNLVVFKGTEPKAIHSITGSQKFGNVLIAKNNPVSPQINNTVSNENGFIDVNGDFTIADNNRLSLNNTSLWVEGIFSVSTNSIDFVLSEESSLSCSELAIYGNLLITGGGITIYDTLFQGASSTLTINSGFCDIQADYTGAYHSFAGETVINGGSLEITNGGMQFGTGSNLTINGGTVKVGWGIRAMQPGFQQNSGAIELIGPLSADIQMLAGNYLNDLIISKTGSGACYLSSDITINNLTINSGTFGVLNHTLNVNGNVNLTGGYLNGSNESSVINLKGSWINDTGANRFVEGNGIVNFNFDRNAQVSTESFNNVGVNKSTPDLVELTIMNDATMTVKGWLGITFGLMKLGDGSTLDVRGNLGIMDGGGLDITSSETLNTLRLSGNLYDGNDLFSYPTGFNAATNNRVILNGSTNQTLNSDYAAHFFFADLIVDKTGGSVKPFKDTIVTGDFKILNGDWSYGLSGRAKEFHGDFLVESNGSFNDDTGIVKLIDESDIDFYVKGNAQMGSLLIDKSEESIVDISGDVNLTGWTTLSLDSGLINLNGHTLAFEGSLTVGADAKFSLAGNSVLDLFDNSSLTIDSGGQFYSLGTPAEPVLITSSDGYYSFTANNNSLIGAEYTVFERMDLTGINIGNGSYVDTDHTFTGCTFRNGESGGTLFRFNATGEYNITGARFPENTWGSLYNVQRINPWNSVTFSNYSGMFAGEDYHDTGYYGTIHWDPVFPQFHIVPPFGHFGIVEPGSVSYEQIFLITNLGDGTIVLNPWDIEITGPDALEFYLDNITQTTYLDNSESAVISVTFLPGSIGQKTAALSINDNLSRSGNLNITEITPIAREAVTREIHEIPLSGLAVLTDYPYFENFEAGAAGWYSGADAGNDQWQLGSPDEFNSVINSAYSDFNAWMTYLDADYDHNADSWLISPPLSFSEVHLPMFSVWLNIWCEDSYDGMILESSVDWGNSWQKVTGDTGFYNNTGSSGSLSPPKWSGNSPGIDGVWREFSTSLDGLENEYIVYLRFRFVSNSTVSYDGIAIDDISIWDAATPEMTIYPLSYDFGMIEEGRITREVEFEITNTGYGVIELSPSDLEITGIDASQFDLYIPFTETLPIYSGESVFVWVSFAPTSIGLKEASLQINDNLNGARDLSVVRSNQPAYNNRTRDIHNVSLYGEGIERIVNLLLDEDFSDVALNTIPADWERDDTYWYVTNSSLAGGEAPEMRYEWSHQPSGEYYLYSPYLDTSDYVELELAFKHSCDHYSNSFTLKVLAIDRLDEYPVQEWENVSSSIIEEAVRLTLTDLEHGVGSDSLRIAWVFSGLPYDLNHWFIDDVKVVNYPPYPYIAHTPSPADNSENVSVHSKLAWIYSNTPTYSDPIGFRVRASTEPDMQGYAETYVVGGTGYHEISPFFEVTFGQTYYWQVIPTTDPPGRERTGNRSREDALNCPIWSFTYEEEPVRISQFPYFEDFENGHGNWSGDANSSMYLWELGTPAQAEINSAYSGTTCWMTILEYDYVNLSDVWLVSPVFDFSELDNPHLSVRMNFRTEEDQDYLILETSIDYGTSWYYVYVAEGFYNNDEGIGSFPLPMWSGTSDGWTLYSTALPSELANQEMIMFRFRFLSNSSITDEGFAIDDITIWQPLPPELVITPSSHDFGEIRVNSESTVQEFTLSNAGDGTITINPGNVMLMGDDYLDFTLSEITETIVLSGDTTANIGVTFAPDTAGPKSAYVEIFSSDIPLRESNISLEQSKRDRSASQRSLSTINLTGEALPRPAGSTWENPFVIESFPLTNYQDHTEHYGNDYSSTDILPNSMFIGGNDFVAQFEVFDEGWFSADITGTSMVGIFLMQNTPDPGSPAPLLAYAVNLASTAAIESFVLDPGFYYLIVSTSQGQQTTPFTLNVNFEPFPVIPEFSYNPDHLDFNAVHINQTSNIELITITNTGGGLLEVRPEDISLTGDHAAEFSHNFLETIYLGMSESFSFSVSFSPLSLGAKNAILRIEDPFGEEVRFSSNVTRNPRSDNTQRTSYDITLEGIGYDGTIIPPHTEAFTGSLFPPLEWKIYSGLLTENSELTPASSVWNHHPFANTGEVNNSAHIQIVGARNHWLVTPPIDLGSGNKRLEFDIALTPSAGSEQTDLGENDLIAVVISYDDGVTWSQNNILKSWEFPETISPAGETVSIDLESIAGTVKIGFYAERPFGLTPNNRFYVTNFSVSEIPENPVLEVSLNEMDFGVQNLYTESVIQEFIISNAGTGTLTIDPSQISLTGDNPDQFILDNLEETVHLILHDTAVIGVRFSPDSEGSKNASIVISEELSERISITPSASLHGNTEDIPVPRSDYQISLSGTGYDPTISVPFTVNLMPFPPTDWEKPFGVLTENSEFSPSSSADWVSASFANNPENDWGARIRLRVATSESVHRWFISPPIDMNDLEADYELVFDIAVTELNSEEPAQLGTQDFFAVVVSSDNGVTWSASNTIYSLSGLNGDPVAAGGEQVIVSLSGVEGTVKLGFYMERPSGIDPEINFHLSNIHTRETASVLATPIISSAYLENGVFYLNWNTVEGANSYKIYARSEPVTNESDPLQGWQLLMHQDSSVTTYSEAASNRRYYRVVASPLPVTR